jgi:hypothetical protein
MKIPATIRAGDTIKWRDLPTTDVLGAPIDGSTHGLTYYLRTNHTHQGATVAGVTVPGAPNGTGWNFTITSTTSAGFVADTWFWQAIATANVGGAKLTLGSGSLVVEASLAYTGTPSKFDGRTQARIDLEAVQAAIRSMVSGGAVAEYTIGNRRLKKMELADLLALESKLKADVVREERAAMIANGMGDPRKVYVRFTR